MTRRLDFRIVEIGPCFNCGKEAGYHSVEGICKPSALPHTHRRDVPEQCYSARTEYAFVDLDLPHTMPTPAASAA